MINLILHVFRELYHVPGIFMNNLPTGDIIVEPLTITKGLIGR